MTEPAPARMNEEEKDFFTHLARQAYPTADDQIMLVAVGVERGQFHPADGLDIARRLHSNPDIAETIYTRKRAEVAVEIDAIGAVTFDDLTEMLANRIQAISIGHNSDDLDLDDDLDPSSDLNDTIPEWYLIASRSIDYIARYDAWTKAGFNAYHVTGDGLSFVIKFSELEYFTPDDESDIPYLSIATDDFDIELPLAIENAEFDDFHIDFTDNDGDRYRVRPVLDIDKEDIARQIAFSTKIRTTARARVKQMIGVEQAYHNTDDGSPAEAFLSILLDAVNEGGTITMRQGKLIETSDYPYNLKVTPTNVSFGKIIIPLNPSDLIEMVVDDETSHFLAHDEEVWITYREERPYTAALLPQLIESMTACRSFNGFIQIELDGLTTIVHADNIAQTYDHHAREVSPTDAIRFTKDIVIEMANVGWNNFYPDAHEFDGILLDGRRLRISHPD